MSTETLEIPFINRIEKININLSIKKVGSINPDPIKDKINNQLHTYRNTVLHVSLITKDWENCWYSIMENYKKSVHRTIVHQEKGNKRISPSEKHTHGSWPKDFNKNSDTSISDPLKAKTSRHQPIINPDHFENHMTKSIICTITMVTLTLLACMKNTLEKMMRKKNYLKIQTKIQSLRIFRNICPDLENNLLLSTIDSGLMTVRHN